MKDLQEVFLRLQEAKKKQKEIRSAYKEALAANTGYKDLTEQLNTLRAKKKQVEIMVKEQFSSEFTKLDDLKIDIESDMQMLADIALSQMVKGETVEVTDQYENKYEPLFTVKFKKAN